MTEHSKGTPLSKGTRDAICEEARRVWGTRFQRFSAETIFDYEATVSALEAKLAETQANYQTMLDTACREASIRQRAEIELARLRPLAEVGEAVEGMRPGDVLLRASETKWRTGAGAMASTTNRSITIIHWADKVRNTALAALRAAKGETDG